MLPGSVASEPGARARRTRYVEGDGVLCVRSRGDARPVWRGGWARGSGVDPAARPGSTLCGLGSVWGNPEIDSRPTPPSRSLSEPWLGEV